jgi:hypothetical protein
MKEWERCPYRCIETKKPQDLPEPCGPSSRKSGKSAVQAAALLDAPLSEPEVDDSDELDFDDSDELEAGLSLEPLVALSVLAESPEPPPLPLRA